MKKINICKDFTSTPGGRYRADGIFSGEEFRETLLIPRYNEAREANEKLAIALDGGYGYPIGFLDEAFGGLARIYGSKSVLDILIFISEEEPELIEEIFSCINNAN